MSPPVPDVPAPAADLPIAADAAFGRFRCNPFACRAVCCTGWPSGQGIRLTVQDLARLDAAGLSDGVEGVFASAADVAAWRAEPDRLPRPDSPRMRSVDGRCVYYDPAARRCTIWEHRPMICRTFPYAVDYVTADGVVHVAFAAGCSLVGPAEDQTRVARGEAVPVRYLAIRRAAQPERLGSLPEYDRRHVDDVLVSAAEQAETLDMVTGDRERVAAMGLGRFLVERITGAV